MDEQTIFSQALAIESDEERSKFLDSACGDDRELRARIERLLRLQEDAGSFLEKTPDELVALAETKADESERESADRWKESLEPSDDPNSLGRLGPYEIAELIGRGGMGVVLRAFDSKLKRTVAIKILAPEFTANPMAVRRFLREARSAAAVSHDHVVTIHAIDEETQPPRIVMEFIDGQSLQQKIDNEGALDLKSILRIGMQTAAGLSAAHKQGLVHRDIKPSNILLENGIERVKLTDFGLARAVDDIGVTRTGQITGTPQYMSPEQAQGHRVDHRTDLFSLGCVLYAMCTGRAAFRADSAVAVMHRVVHDTPKPIREANEEIPEWLCEIVDKLLEKNPEDRFASAREVEELLGQHLAHLQQPQSVPRPESLGPPVSRLGRQIDEDLISAARTFLGTGMACLIFFVLTFLGLSNDWLRNWNEGLVIVFVMGGLISLPVGLLAMNAHFDVQRRTRYRWVNWAAQSALIPWNPLLLLALPWSIQVVRILKRPDVKRAFGVEATDAIAPASRPDRARISFFILLAILIGYVGSELLGITHGVVRTIDNFNDQGRIELTSLGGNVTVRGPSGRSLGTETLAQGLGSPDQTRTFSTPLYPGKYEVQFYSDKHTMTGLKEIEIVRGGIVRVHAPQGIEQVDLAQSGPVVTGSGIPFEFRQIDRLLVAMCLLVLFALAGLIRIRNRGEDRRAALPSRILAAAILLLATLVVLLLNGLFGVPRPAPMDEVRGPYVGAFPVLADEPPTREEITAESNELPRPQIKSPDSGTSAEGDSQSSIKPWPFWMQEDQSDPILAIDLRKDGSWMASGHRGGDALRWPLNSSGEPQNESHVKSNMTASKLRPKGNRRPQYKYHPKRENSDIYDIEYASRGGALAWVESNGQLRLFTNELHQFDRYPQIDDTFRSLAWAADNKTILVGGQGKLYVWNIDQHDGPVATVDVPGNALVLNIAFSPHDNEFATALADGNIILWNFEESTPTLKTTLHEAGGKPAHAGAANALAYSPTEPLLVSCGDDGEVKGWTFNETESPLWTQNYANGKALLSVQVSHNGKMCATVGEDRQLHLFDIHTLESLIEGPIQGAEIHDAEITAVRFSWSDDILTTASTDGFIKKWYYNEQATSGNASPGSSAELLTSNEYEWTEPENLGSLVNTDESEASPTLSSDGLMMIFCRTRSEVFADKAIRPAVFNLWQTTRETVDDPWSEPVELSPNVNSAGSDSSPCLSGDGLTLWFSSNREGGEGEFDLWMCTRNSRDEEWSTPVNLGSTVNSNGQELCPTLSEDQLTLIFAYKESERPRDNADIYYDFRMCSRKSKSDPWSKPVNLLSSDGTRLRGHGPRLTEDGLSLLFLQGSHRQIPNLCVATRPNRESRWSNSIRIGHRIDSESEVDVAYYSLRHQFLIFASRRNDKRGEGDLWMSKLVRKQPISTPPSTQTAGMSNEQWKELLSKAASIPLNEWNTLAGDIKGPNAVAVRGEPLSLVLLNLDPFAEQKQNEHVIRDFWYLTETLPKLQELANAISVSKKEGYVSFLQPERMTNLTFEEADGTVEGSVGFSVPKLYSGRVEFMARRYYDNIWRIDEFRLPNYDITLRRNTQNLWQKVRTNRNSGNRTEGSRSSP